MIYDRNGTVLSSVFHSKGESLAQAFDYTGTKVYESGYTPTTEYEQALFNAMQEWKSKRTEFVVPLIVHTDQHSYLNRNKIFDTLTKMRATDGISAVLNLGDVTDYNVSNFNSMVDALSYIPRSKQINIWGNHETWIQTGSTPPYRNPTTEEFNVLSTFYDNSEYGIQHVYNNYGIQYLIDEVNKIKYVVLAGWEYDSQLGSYNYYVIGQQSMNYVVQMLSTVDEYDIVVISHIQPFYHLQTASLWTHPPVETDDPQGGQGSMSWSVGCVATNVDIDVLINGRKNKTSGVVKDSYGNDHPFDFTHCTSDLLCCLAGHEHFDKYAWANNGTIPIYIFDGYGFDNHPIFFANIDKQQQKIELWKIDETPHIYNFSIPFAKPNI